MTTYLLPADFSLSDSQSLAYQPVTEAADLEALVAPFAPEAVWHATIKLQGPPTLDELVQLCLQDRELTFWRVVSKASGAAVATCLINTLAADWHVGVHHAGRFAPGRHSEVVWHLACGIFRAVPSAKEVWNALPLPEPVGGEEALTSIGFTEVPSGLDREKRRTYGLFRPIWQAYADG